MADRFPSPFDIPTPEGAEGWQDLYAYSSLFSEDRREYEDSMFWFQDGVHWPQVLTPWDATFYEFAITSLSQYNTRHLLVPPANGIDYRIVYDPPVFVRESIRAVQHTLIEAVVLVVLVVGTHTHVPTADERILRGGTAFQTDVGMTGPHDSVIGRNTTAVLKHFTTGVHVPFDMGSGGEAVQGALVEVDLATGRARSIERINLPARVPQR